MLSRTLIHRTLCALAVAAATLTLSTTASAARIDYTLQQGVQDGFGFSSIHQATGCNYMCGAQLTEINGVLSMDFDGTNYNVLGTSTLLGDVVSMPSGDVQWKLEILAGSISAATGGGHLDYRLSKGLWVSNGTFNFARGTQAGPANSISDSHIALWGWNADSEWGDIGIDIGATVPEPSAALVFGVGALALGRGVSRKN